MPSAPANPDVLILGGGLAGAAAAISLARAGRHVVMAEREPVSRHKVCGEFLSAEALHLLGGLGIDLKLHGAQPIHTVRLASQRYVTTSTLPFAARSLTRRSLDSLLLQAAEGAGAEVLRGCSVEGLKATGDCWLATLHDGRLLEAGKVVLATGKHDLRGFPRPQGVQGDLVAMKMYFRLAPEEAASLEGAVELLLHPHGYTGLEPVEDGANVTALVRRHHLARLGGWQGLLTELLHTNPHARQRLAGAEPLLAKPLAISSIPYGFVRRRAPGANLYAVGDQAAVIPSFTGDGMSIALLSGLRAAESLLAGQPAEDFQHELHRALRWQVARATALSRALVYAPARGVLTTAARLWPNGLQAAASLTRVPPAALGRLQLQTRSAVSSSV